MDARTLLFGCIAALAIQLVTEAGAAAAERHETANFLVTASDESVARKVAEAAEHYRRELALYWLGKPMPTWSRPCRISVNVGALGAGGQTTFQFVNGEVLNWRMSVQGSLERILDSVIPHEVNHTIFACHFRRPLPRWADEGAATLFEHESEKIKQLHLLNQVIRDRGQHFSLSELLSMKDYPEDPQRMLTLYAQGYTLVDFLVQQKGRQVYLELLGAAEKQGWEEAIRAHFDHEGIAALERNWRSWVLAGRPRLLQGEASLLASAESGDQATEVLASKRNSGEVRPQFSVRSRAGASREVVRSQSPDTESAESAVVPVAGPRTKAVPERSAKTGFRSASVQAPIPGSLTTAGSGSGSRSGVTGRSVSGATGAAAAKAAAAPATASGRRSGSAVEAKTVEEAGRTGEGWFDETRPDRSATEATEPAEPRGTLGAGSEADAGRVRPARGKSFVSTGHVVSEGLGSVPIRADGTPGWAGFPGTGRFF